MTEMTDDLSTPLGQKTERRKRRFRLPFTAMQALAVMLGLFLVAFLAVALFTDNPFGGEPVARIALRQPADEKAPASGTGKPEQATKSASQAPSGDNKTVTIIDGSSGKRQDVVIGGDSADKGGAEPAPSAAMTGIDQRLLGKVQIRHDPDDCRRPQALHGLCRRCRPRQGRQDAGHRHRRRRPRGRRRQDGRCHHEAAAGGDAGLHPLRRGPRQARRTRPGAASRDPAAGSDGAVRLSRQ